MLLLPLGRWILAPNRTVIPAPGTVVQVTAVVEHLTSEGPGIRIHIRWLTAGGEYRLALPGPGPTDYAYQTRPLPVAHPLGGYALSSTP